MNSPIFTGKLTKPNEWLPIETAPKDGTSVITLHFQYIDMPFIHVAWYRSAEEWGEHGCPGFESIEEWTGWWSYPESTVTQYKLCDYREPQYWMPLNLPPEGMK